jgi:hypothetical protein
LTKDVGANNRDDAEDENPEHGHEADANQEEG